MPGKLDDPRFRQRRARKGGQTRAKNRSRLWQALMMHYLTEKRAGRTQSPTFKAWLMSHGFERVAEEAERQPQKSQQRKQKRA